LIAHHAAAACLLKQECCELIIGSIPLWSSLHHQPALPSAPFIAEPPSYEECVFGRQDVDLADGTLVAGGGGGAASSRQVQWAPSYPVYHQNRQHSLGLPPVA
uniref:NAC domain-containing protein n=1 Tax=Macrostomum lignano TaxID=282301 RepID=A0A1I8IS57_9PLAT